MTRVLVLGASGFIGSAVVRALAGEPGVAVVGARRRPGADHTGPVVEVRERASLDCVQDADVVVHAAHAVRGDEATLHETNVLGTGNVVEACRRARARLVAISTASVYGPGPWRGDDVQDRAPSAVSAVSRSRAEGDELVLWADGLVVRPHLVHGPGDRWFVPTALRLVAEVGWIEAASRHSTIHVDTLGRAVAGWALAGAPSGVRLCSDPPLPLQEVLAPYVGSTSVDPGVTRAAALRHPAGRRWDNWAHLVDLMALDHHLTDSAATPGTEDPAWLSPRGR